MSTTAIEIKGVEQAAAKILALGPLFEKAAQALIAETVLFAEVAIADQIDEMHAVKTGRMKGSISAATAFEPKDTATAIDSDGLGATVGTNVAYAAAVHDGYTRTYTKAPKTVRFTKKGEIAKYSQRRGYSKQEDSDGVTRTVEGRPFIRAALPDIEAMFQKRARERFGSVV